MKITFNGASEVVTGSCYLVETDSVRFLVDCGMFQGPADEHRNKQFNFDPKTVDFILLTHAHIDHSGLLPKMFREGFKGEIYATHPTIQISELLLKDSAKIQEGNVKRGNVTQQELLFDTNDVLDCLSKFRPVNFYDENSYGNVKFKYIRAGHVLGAASIIIESEGKKIVFSGDIGRKDQTLIKSYDLPGEEVDYVIMESLYGGVIHPERKESLQKFLDAIHFIFANDGNVTIPSFALHRSQELILDLKNLFLENQLGQDVQVYLDGPLADGITKIYSQYIGEEIFSFNGLENLNYPQDNSMFLFENFRIIRDYRDSLRLMRRSHRIILAGSGMCDGGRIVNHLLKGLKKPNNGVIFVGFQAEGTLGRAITEGAKEVSISGKKVPVNAKIFDIHGFSAHADSNDLMTWLDDKKSDRLKKVFLVHAELERSQKFKEIIEPKGYSAVIPHLHQTIEL